MRTYFNDRHVYDHIDTYFNDKCTSEAFHTWMSAVENGAQTCIDLGINRFDNSYSNGRSDAMITYTLETLRSLLDNNYAGEKLFVSLGFKY